MRFVWFVIFEWEPRNEDGELSRAARIAKWAGYVLVSLAVLGVIGWRLLH